ncbi:MAG TPA: hypothetical protein DHU89_08725 [Flavobacteriales bacterium]|nr:hypothetical protein [Flavobacteriales bacterium]|tara:strand:+ start:4511 stop:4909 length:399 start_codon:yes stop_codon:yes gene_type:complete
MNVLYPFLILALFTGCSYHYEEVSSLGYAKGELVHTVILALKGDVSQKRKEEIIRLLGSLSEIDETQGLTVSTKARTNDTRAQRDYDLILQMSFKSQTELESYSINAHHLDVRAKLKSDLASAPVVYDYWVE